MPFSARYMLLLDPSAEQIFLSGRSQFRPSSYLPRLRTLNLFLRQVTSCTFTIAMADSGRACSAILEFWCAPSTLHRAYSIVTNPQMGHHWLAHYPYENGRQPNIESGVDLMVPVVMMLASPFLFWLTLALSSFVPHLATKPVIHSKSPA